MGSNFICSDTFDEDNVELEAFKRKGKRFNYILGNPPWQRGRVEREPGGKKKMPLYERYLKLDFSSTILS